MVNAGRLVGGCTGEGGLSPLTVSSGGFPDSNDSFQKEADYELSSLLEYRENRYPRISSETPFLIFLFLLTSLLCYLCFSLI